MGCAVVNIFRSVLHIIRGVVGPNLLNNLLGSKYFIVYWIEQGREICPLHTVLVLK